MKYLIKGEEYDFDFDWTLEELFELKEKAYLTMSELSPALARMDPHALCAVAYFAMKRNRVAVKWDDVKKFKISEIVPVFDEEVADSEAVEADPTQPPAASTRKTSSRRGGKTQ